MKKILLAAALCGFLASSCKKEDKKFCFECVSKSTMGSVSSDMEFEHCDLTEDEAKQIEKEGTTNEGDASTTTTCKKK